jgi:benzil reductase ((S)-benzoin forming)
MEAENETRLTQVQFDLNDTEKLADLLSTIFKEIDSETVQKIVLFNNAGTLGEIGRTENLSVENITGAVHVNTIAPLILTSAFIRLTKDWAGEKKIINISSGAAQNPYYGWTIYCATKAALDMLTRTVATEQNAIENGVKIMSIYPGVVDTDMQTEIRKHTKEEFIDIDRFLTLKSSGSLADPTVVAEQIMQIDLQELENGAILRV